MTLTAQTELVRHEAPTVGERLRGLITSALLANFKIYISSIRSQVVRSEPKIPHIMLKTQVPLLIEAPINYTLKKVASLINIAGKFAIPALHIGAVSGIYEAVQHKKDFWGNLGVKNDVILYLDKWDNPSTNILTVGDRIYKYIAFVDNLPRAIQEIFYKGITETNLSEALVWDHLIRIPVPSISGFVANSVFWIAAKGEAATRNLVHWNSEIAQIPDFIYHPSLTPTIHYANQAIDALNNLGEKYHGAPLAIALLTLISIDVVRYLSPNKQNSGVSTTPITSSQSQNERTPNSQVLNLNQPEPHGSGNTSKGSFEQEFELLFKGHLQIPESQIDDTIIGFWNKYQTQIGQTVSIPSATSILNELHNLAKHEDLKVQLRDVLVQINIP